MTNGWKEVGRLARLRRERLGLKQEDLRLYGGPRVATVGKLERGAQDNFPLRTQQQMERALGWRRGAIGDVLNAFDRPGADYEDWRGDFEEDLVDGPAPDLSLTADRRPADDPHGPAVTRAADLSDDELLAELTYRMKRYSNQVGAEEQAEGDRDRGANSSSRGDLQRAREMTVVLGNPLGDLDDQQVAAHDEEHDIEAEQGHDEFP